MTTYSCKNEPRPRSGSVVRDGTASFGEVVAMTLWRGKDGDKLAFHE